MNITKTIPTQFGHRLSGEPALIRVAAAADRAALARRLDREADAAMAEGDYRVADILTWRAAGLRETPR